VVAISAHDYTTLTDAAPANMRARRACLCFGLVVVLVAGLTTDNHKLNAPRSALMPIVIVPGTGGSQLEARLDKPSSPHWWCARQADWFRLWLDTKELLLDALTQCWADNIRLMWNETAGAMQNAPGVETRTPDFGGVSAFSELDPSLPLHASSYFRDLIAALEARGYVAGSSLLGAPYDFRYAPSSKVGRRFTADLRALLERAREASGRPALLLAHSYGCLLSLHFLQGQSAAWKAKHVAGFVSAGGPYGGSAHELVVLASGSNEGVATVHPLTIRHEQRTYESNHLMLPSPAVFGAAPLVTTPERTYAPTQYADFFADIGWRHGAQVYGQVRSLLRGFAPPGVPTHCVYAVGQRTERNYTYGRGWPDAQPERVGHGDGDGTVNVESAEVCRRWPGTNVTVLRGVAHMDIVKDGDFIAAVEALLADVGAPPAEGVRAERGSEIAV
jgi:hypothetical protein